MTNRTVHRSTDTFTDTARSTPVSTPELEPQDDSTASRVADSAHKLIDNTAAKAEEVERQLRRKAAKAGEKYEDTKETANEQVEQSLAKVESFVREKPMTAAGIAFAAGIIASSILRR